MIRNDIYVGSVKDTDGIWHPVVSSFNEDIIVDFIENSIDFSNEGFWTEEYTIELIPIIMNEEVYND